MNEKNNTPSDPAKPASGRPVPVVIDKVGPVIGRPIGPVQGLEGDDPPPPTPPPGNPLPPPPTPPTCTTLNGRVGWTLPIGPRITKPSLTNEDPSGGPDGEPPPEVTPDPRGPIPDATPPTCTTLNGRIAGDGGSSASETEPPLSPEALARLKHRLGM